MLLPPRRCPGRSALPLLLALPLGVPLIMLTYVCQSGQCVHHVPPPAPPSPAQKTKVATSTELPDTAPTCPPQNVSIISINSAGRLGNVMSEYATLLALSVKFRCSAWILDKMDRTLRQVFVKPSLPVVSSHCAITWNITDLKAIKEQLSSGKTVRSPQLIIGHYAEVPLFAPLRFQLQQREFQFRPELMARAQLLLRKVAAIAGRSPNDTTFVAVHVRRTDYADWLRDKVRGQLAGSDYLNRAVNLMRRRHPRALFVVTSDDLDWCRQHLGAPDVFFLGSRTLRWPGSDLALLAACNHTVVTHGTYGFWAAFLAGGEVVKPAEYGHKPTALDTSIDKAGLGWLKLKTFMYS